MKDRCSHCASIIPAAALVCAYCHGLTRRGVALGAGMFGAALGLLIWAMAGMVGR